MMKAGDVIRERYELEELAGTGGMSNVYRAYDRRLERRVAIKVLHERYTHDEEYVSRFTREARAIARLTHPNIVTVIDRGEWEGSQYIVFEYVGGETLKEVIEREGRLPVEEALRIVRDVAAGLACAHENGVVHRDVKPHNVLIDPEGMPKVTDFGIARSIDRDDGLTLTGTFLGTSDYLAPEQAAGQPVSAQSDQYSLGALLFELLAGEVPYPAESLVQAAMRHMHDPVPSVRSRRPDVPPAVDELVGRAMQKRPEDRFASTEAFVRALDVCLAGLDEDTLSDVRVGELTRQLEPAPAARPARRRRGPGAAVVVAVLLVAGGVAAAVFIALAATGDGDGGRGGGGGGGGSDTTAAIRLVAESDYDPDGDETEHPEAVGEATDGDRATYWTTETYATFDKPGVGLVLRASRSVEGGTVVIRTDEPGFTAEIQGSNRATGGFTTISDSQTVEDGARFALDTGGESYRFLLVWITDPGPAGRAHVNEGVLRD